ncbi:hypothetical protein BOTBODRAFT_146841 [Botryobasidium botryosum FD-172 SS1]|uniref:Uncharacterized protein n=1 Tax=Botryobasidium botryosum (strain FD-172 SS1) TaxID=930990 RepID=A0A067M964_BOTB1|nr:hypothetical protein BOTBODRAFT_146841 [Botryobasidium botryosum FD-172 SS1]
MIIDVSNCHSLLALIQVLREGYGAQPDRKAKVSAAFGALEATISDEAISMDLANIATLSLSRTSNSTEELGATQAQQLEREKEEQRHGDERLREAKAGMKEGIMQAERHAVVMMQQMELAQEREKEEKRRGDERLVEMREQFEQRLAELWSAHNADK